MMKNKYIAPEITVVSFKNERGYFASSLRLTHAMEVDDDYNASNQEKWESGGSLFDAWSTH